MIGDAADDIATGAPVHTHDPEFRHVEIAAAFSTNLRPALPAATRDSFMGLRRPVGRIAT